MELVSSLTPAQIAERQAVEEIQHQLRWLTINLLRVTRGAGKPHEIAEDVVSLARAFLAHSDLTKRRPDPVDLTEALSGWRSERLYEMPASHANREHALRQIMGGAMQVAASRLAGQRTQVSRGEDELLDGVRAYERWQEEAYARVRADRRPPPPKRGPKQKS